MVAGTNKLASMVLHALNLEHTQVPRFRDAYLDIDELNRPKLVLLTRTGGPNRPSYVSENETLSGLAGFIGDHDDAYDRTFAHWQFEVPADAAPSVKAAIAEIIEMASDPESGLDPEILMKPMERFQSRLNGTGWDAGPMAEQLKEALRKAAGDAAEE
jgi:hypothetical protein